MAESASELMGNMDAIPEPTVVALQHRLPAEALHADITLAPQQSAAEEEVERVPDRGLRRAVGKVLRRRRRPAPRLLHISARHAHAAPTRLD